MNAQDIGKKLVSLCREGKNAEAIDLLYSKDIVSLEAFVPPPMPLEVRGLEAVKGKGKWWFDNHTIHSAKIEGPFPNGDRFIVQFNYDLTAKASGQRFSMEEMALYEVQNGKIVREAFFYTTGGAA